MAFECAARQRFGRAAKELNTSPSAASRQVSKLEHLFSTRVLI
jgi:DNA-binding transcriptional LysR family regulator